MVSFPGVCPTSLSTPPVRDLEEASSSVAWSTQPAILPPSVRGLTYPAGREGGEGRREGGKEGRREGGKEGRREGGKEGRREGGKEGRREGGKKGRREGGKEGRREGGKEGRREGGESGRQREEHYGTAILKA